MLQRFEQLDQLLVQYRQFWQIQPFHWPQSCWQSRMPELHQALQNLTDQQISLYQDKKARASFLNAWIPEAETLLALCEVPAIPRHEYPVNSSLNYEINGRKWQQIIDFSACVKPGSNVITEWCAGKGHLGRVLASRGACVQSIEWQCALCSQGEKLAARAGLAMQFHHTDVLAQDCADHFSAATSVVALHACGELHHRLLQLAVQHRIQGVYLAPCCYHLINHSRYQPFSMAAKNSRMVLHKHDLKLPLQETVTAGRRIRTRRATGVIWRLAFDSLQRHVRAVDEYLPLPAIPEPLLKSTFSEFCGWAAEQKQLVLPENTDWTFWQAEGMQRYQAVQQMEFVQHLFRRPLEIWLLLDKALFLQENGYTVEIGTFCDYAVTPRNLMIKALRH